MELTSSTHLAYILAASEASFLKSTHLDPEHFLLGIFKIESLIHHEFLLPKQIDQDKKEQIVHDASALSELWKAHQVDPKQFRRRLRFLISQEQKETGSFSGHRSPRGRELFEHAEEITRERDQEAVSLTSLLAACLQAQSKLIEMLFAEYKIDRQELSEAAVKLDLDEPEIEAQEPAPGEEQETPPASGIQKHNLAKYGRDLTYLAHQGKLGPIIGRREEIKNIGRILTQRSRNNPLLLGEPGVGKTAVVEGLALYAASEDAVESLRALHVVEITMSALVAGTKFRGEFETKVQEVIKEAENDPNLVLFIDELHTMMGAGAGEGALDASNILKPALGRGEINCIGASTTTEFRKHIEPDGALTRRFQVVWIDEPSHQETVQILQGIKPKMESHHGLVIQDALLTEIVTLTNRFITDSYQPDKAIMVLDEACARRKLMTIGTLAPGIQTGAVELDDIGEVIARRSQVPLEVILTRDEERLLKIEEELGKHIIGQDHAISALAKAIRISRAGLKPPNRPVVLLFAGPTGTGKTELAKVLSRFLFFDAKRLIQLDMSEYAEQHASAKILGSPPGYIGFAEETKFIREIRLHPYSVVLLDEIEKAHPGIMKTFLQVFDEGRLTDARGRTINCSETIFIMTTNLGTGVKVKPAIGFLLSGDEAQREQNAAVELYQKAIVSFLSPELVNRIQDMVIFKPLTGEAISRILDIYLAATNRRLAPREITVDLDDSAKAFISQEGTSEQYGARFLKRVFDRWITEPLSEYILAGELSAGDTALFSYTQSQMQVQAEGTAGARTLAYTLHNNLPLNGSETA